jgi:hypothetical protein
MHSNLLLSQKFHVQLYRKHVNNRLKLQFVCGSKRDVKKYDRKHPDKKLID